ncbi:hypothetical protein B0H13DRAFT_2667154 [Mycena leptocephala]|nr:hypothetical protein B0H13DRAFT_2667154 [Mycena leptocephala]
MTRAMPPRCYGGSWAVNPSMHLAVVVPSLWTALGCDPLAMRPPPYGPSTPLAIGASPISRRQRCYPDGYRGGPRPASRAVSSPLRRCPTSRPEYPSARDPQAPPRRHMANPLLPHSSCLANASSPRRSVRSFISMTSFRSCLRVPRAAFNVPDMVHQRLLRVLFRSMPPTFRRPSLRIRARPRLYPCIAVGICGSVKGLHAVVSGKGPTDACMTGEPQCYSSAHNTSRRHLNAYYLLYHSPPSLFTPGACVRNPILVMLAAPPPSLPSASVAPFYTCHQWCPSAFRALYTSASICLHTQLSSKYGRHIVILSHMGQSWKPLLESYCTPTVLLQILSTPLASNMTCFYLNLFAGSCAPFVAGRNKESMVLG